MKKKYAIIIFITLAVLMLACLLLMHKPDRTPTGQTTSAPLITQTAQQTTPPPAQQESAAQTTAQETPQPTAAQTTPQETAQPTAATPPPAQNEAEQPPTDEPQKGVYRVNAYKFIRLYKKPDTASTIVTNIPNGTMLTVKSIEKDSSGTYWGRTEFKTQSGWVQMQDMKK